MPETILYIEDNPFNMRLVGKMLKMSGFEMVGAITGLDGLAMVAEKTPDLILLDINLPDIDGMEVLAQLTADPNFNIPVIALTANAMYGDRERFLEAGCNGYISKPVDRRELIESVSQFLGQNQTINE
ncbi:MAG: response regulator [Phototrophicaceae bacterium]